jgi:serine/threonine protein kinase
MDLNDSVLDHLRHVAALPDLTATRYVLKQEIGRGGLGVVYAAHDRDLDRQVALKVLDSTLARV